MALTEEDFSTVTIHQFASLEEGELFDPGKGHFLRNGRETRLSHVYERFRDRAQPGMPTVTMMPRTLKQFALADGLFLADRPSWLGGTRADAYCYLVIGEYMALPVEQHGSKYTAKTAMVREDVTWAEAFERGWVSIPRRPDERPALVEQMTLGEAELLAEGHFQREFPKMPALDFFDFLPPWWGEKAERRREKSARRKRYLNEGLARKQALVSHWASHFRYTQQSRDQLARYEHEMGQYRAALAAAGCQYLPQI